MSGDEVSSSPVTILASHLRGEHRSRSIEGCPACEGTAAGSRPRATAQEPKKARKRPPAGNRRCEHCGAPTSSRFAPGHDAKLKSELLAAAQSGDSHAVAELCIREWETYAGAAAIGKIPREVWCKGVEVAEREGIEFLRGRNALRQDRAG